MKRTFNHEDIARLARHIWQLEGCQSGRDDENWLKAEHLLLLVSASASERAEVKDTPATLPAVKVAKGAVHFRRPRPVQPAPFAGVSAR